MKKILFVYPKRFLENQNANLHTRWTEYLKDAYDVQWWGENFVPITELNQKGFESAIDKFSPDYIYMTIRSRYAGLKISLRGIKVPSIFVECDTHNYNCADGWYTQFSYLYRRNVWDWTSGWASVPCLLFSIPEQLIIHSNPSDRKGIGFIGTDRASYYKERNIIKQTYGKSITFANIIKPSVYWAHMRRHKAMVCPTESYRGDFLPGKFFEYLASGAAVITNCNLDKLGVPEFNEKVIKYTDIDSLGRVLATTDFSPYYECAYDVLRTAHTDRVRYGSIFK